MEDMKLLIAIRRLEFLQRFCGSGSGNDLCQVLADAA